MGSSSRASPSRRLNVVASAPRRLMARKARLDAACRKPCQVSKPHRTLQEQCPPRTRAELAARSDDRLPAPPRGGDAIPLAPRELPPAAAGEAGRTGWRGSAAVPVSTSADDPEPGWSAHEPAPYASC